MTVWNLGNQALANATPAAYWRPIRLGPGFIDEDQAGRINLALMFFPLLPPARDVRAVLLAGVQTFF